MSIIGQYYNHHDEISNITNIINITNITNILNTAYIPYFKNNKVWAGYNEVVWFLNPKREIVKASVYWFTNFKINNRPKYKNYAVKRNTGKIYKN